MTNINLKNSEGAGQEKQVTQRRHNCKELRGQQDDGRTSSCFRHKCKRRRRREELAHVYSRRAFLPTAFVLLLPHCDEERGDSSAIFSPIIRLVVLLLARVFFLDFLLFSSLVLRASSSVASRLDFKYCASARPHCSMTQVKMNMESET